MSVCVHKTLPIVCVGPVAKILPSIDLEVIVIYGGTRKVLVDMADSTKELMQITEWLSITAGDQRRLAISVEVFNKQYEKVEVN